MYIYIYVYWVKGLRVKVTLGVKGLTPQRRRRRRRRRSKTYH